MIQIIATLSAILAFNLFAMDAHAGCATKSQARAAYPTSYLKYSVRHGKRCWIAARSAKRVVKRKGKRNVRVARAVRNSSGISNPVPVLGDVREEPVTNYVASNFPDLRPDEEVRKDFRTVIVERFTPLPKIQLTEETDPNIWPKKAEWAHEGIGKYSIAFLGLGIFGALTFGTALGLRRRK